MSRLTADTLYQECNPEQFSFETTDEINNSATIIGQERLTASLEFGTGMHDDGFNIFALGPNKTNKEDHLQQFFEEKSVAEPTPPDICYVNNFDDRYQPRVMLLPAGRGCDLEQAMSQLIGDLVPTLTSAFETEEYQNRRQGLQDEVQQQQDQTFEDLQEEAREKGLALIRTPAGFSFAPLDEDGEMMDQEAVQDLSQEKREELQEKTKELQQELQNIIQQMPSNQRKMRERKKELDKEIAAYAIDDLIKEVKNQFEDLEAVQEYLKKVKADIVDNVQAIMSDQGQQQNGNQLMQMLGGQQDGQEGGSGRHPVLNRYLVNVMVDNDETKGAPVIFEDNPNYKNLIGRVEYKSQMGALTTNFNLIKAGALHRANGGYLIIDARQVLMEPFAWEGLKRVLKSGELKIESFGESYRVISTVSLEPKPIDLDVKVILTGERLLYYLLCEYDPEFNKLFKVEADFEDEIDRSDENDQQFAQLLAGLVEKNDLRPFDRGAVARIIEQGSRMVSDNEKLSTQTSEISRLLKEADYWAGAKDRPAVTCEDVQKAIDQQIYRSARLRDKVQENINRNTIFIDTEGERVGQVNGLSVMQIGNLMFGRPSRITARVQLGKGDIIDIERKVDLSGSIHSKGVLILQGFLGERYASDRPLSLSARLVFEQSYGPVDGDSASSAELYALLSAIGEVPIKQSFSVTGSVNQHGDVQPIGGVNEKIEGFFDICDERGLTGHQGVLIPRSNEKNLMLRSDVREAVADEKFRIHSIETIDEGMELLTGMEMGEADADGHYPKGTVNHKITQKLEKLADKRKAFAKTENNE